MARLLQEEHRACSTVTPEKPVAPYTKYNTLLERANSASAGGGVDHGGWEPDDDELRQLSLNDFEIHGVLGIGTYGVVKLARHLRTGARVALKILSKEHVVSMRQEKHILRERSVHLRVKHPFIAHLLGTFQDEDCLYLLIEYLPGGELWSVVYAGRDEEEDEEEDHPDSEEDEKASIAAVAPLLTPVGQCCSASPLSSSSSATTSTCASTNSSCNLSSVESCAALSASSASTSLVCCTCPLAYSCTCGGGAPLLDARDRRLLRSANGGLREEFAAFYLGCICCALEYLHQEEYLYRDLKLENLVLDDAGYVKLLDFGFAKRSGHDKNMTLCGSIDYMAPEILLHEPHDHRADLWSLGIIMYELLAGQTPFFHENPREMGRRITKEPVQFPNVMEDTHPLACELISHLLAKNPSDRPASVREIKQHAFFARHFGDASAWQQLMQKQRRAPFRPRLHSAFDTSFFEVCCDQDEDEFDDFVQPFVPTCAEETTCFRDF